MQYRDHCKLDCQPRKNTHDLLSSKIALAKQLVAIDKKKILNMNPNLKMKNPRMLPKHIVRPNNHAKKKDLMDTNTGVLSMICHQLDAADWSDVNQKLVHIVQNVKYIYDLMKNKIVS